MSTTSPTRDRRIGLAVCSTALPALLLIMAMSVSGQVHESDKAQASEKAAWFIDIQKKSAITYRTDNNFTGRKYFPQPMCGGIAVLDYDNDGNMDLFFTSGAKLPEMRKTGPQYNNALLRNRGDGTFEDVTAKAGLSGETLGYSFGVAAADYDNDGHEDLFIANAGRNALYHNNGDGTFTDVTQSSGLGSKPENVLSVGAAWFDFDDDGLLDLIVSNYTVWTPETDKQCSLGDVTSRASDHDATMKSETYCSPKVYTSVAPRLYRNLGGGRFADVTESSGLNTARGKGMGVAIADFNHDGFPDVLSPTIPNPTRFSSIMATEHSKNREFFTARRTANPARRFPAWAPMPKILIMTVGTTLSSTIFPASCSRS